METLTILLELGGRPIPGVRCSLSTERSTTTPGTSPSEAFVVLRGQDDATTDTEGRATLQYRPTADIEGVTYTLWLGPSRWSGLELPRGGTDANTLLHDRRADGEDDEHVSQTLAQRIAAEVARQLGPITTRVDALRRDLSTLQTIEGQDIGGLVTRVSAVEARAGTNADGVAANLAAVTEAARIARENQGELTTEITDRRDADTELRKRITALADSLPEFTSQVTVFPPGVVARSGLTRSFRAVLGEAIRVPAGTRKLAVFVQSRDRSLSDEVEVVSWDARLPPGTINFTVKQSDLAPIGLRDADTALNMALSFLAADNTVLGDKEVPFAIGIGPEYGDIDLHSERLLRAAGDGAVRYDVGDNATLVNVIRLQNDSNHVGILVFTADVAHTVQGVTHNFKAGDVAWVPPRADEVGNSEVMFNLGAGPAPGPAPSGSITQAQFDALLSTSSGPFNTRWSQAMARNSNPNLAAIRAAMAANMGNAVEAAWGNQHINAEELLGLAIAAADNGKLIEVVKPTAQARPVLRLVPKPAIPETRELFHAEYDGTVPSNYSGSALDVTWTAETVLTGDATRPFEARAAGGLTCTRKCRIIFEGLMTASPGDTQADTRRGVSFWLRQGTAAEIAAGTASFRQEGGSAYVRGSGNSSLRVGATSHLTEVMDFEVGDQLALQVASADSNNKGKGMATITNIAMRICELPLRG